MLYLSNPLTIEDSFESLSSLPPIQLSICKTFVIGEPPVMEIDLTTEYLEGFGVTSVKTFPPGTILTFANSTEAFWKDMDSRQEYFRPGFKT